MRPGGDVGENERHAVHGVAKQAGAIAKRVPFGLPGPAGIARTNLARVRLMTSAGWLSVREGRVQNRGAVKPKEPLFSVIGDASVSVPIPRHDEKQIEADLDAAVARYVEG
jgi:hypothetical protein